MVYNSIITRIVLYQKWRDKMADKLDKFLGKIKEELKGYYNGDITVATDEMQNLKITFDNPDGEFEYGIQDEEYDYDDLKEDLEAVIQGFGFKYNGHETESGKWIWTYEGDDDFYALFGEPEKSLSPRVRKLLTPAAKAYMGLSIKAGDWVETVDWKGNPQAKLDTEYFYNTNVVEANKEVDKNGKATIIYRVVVGLQVPGFDGKSVGGILLGNFEHEKSFSYDPTITESLTYGVNELAVPAIQRALKTIGEIPVPGM